MGWLESEGPPWVWRRATTAAARAAGAAGRPSAPAHRVRLVADVPELAQLGQHVLLLPLQRLLGVEGAADGAVRLQLQSLQPRRRHPGFLASRGFLWCWCAAPGSAAQTVAPLNALGCSAGAADKQPVGGGGLGSAAVETIICLDWLFPTSSSGIREADEQPLQLNAA
jgi:hypothetical protein